MLRITALLSSLIFLAACAQPFPRPSQTCCSTNEPDGKEIFTRAFMAHGGTKLQQLHDVSLAIDGEWKFLITRIQPLVTDHKYRVKSEERLLPGEAVYAALYQGPAGTKKVVRSRSSTRVFYNETEAVDDDTLLSTALTADSFFIFLLGPLALHQYSEHFVRLNDAQADGKNYYRIYAKISPGIGVSETDEIVLWVDPQNYYVFRIHITLEGYKSTRGAHVDVSYLGYEQRGPFVFPSRFHERVRGPIAIDAHTWWLTGLDINRGFTFDDLNGGYWGGEAAASAQLLKPQ